MLASARGHRPPTVGSRAATRHRAGVCEPVRILASLEPIPLRTAARRCPEVMFLAGRPGVADGAACQESQGGHSLGRTRESLSGQVTFG
jgi:hypothetical protein